MDLKKIFVHIMLGIVFVGTGFLCGYLLGNLFYTPEKPPEKKVILPYETLSPHNTPDTTTPLPAAAPDVITESCFLIQSTGNSIYIYEISDTAKTTVKVFDVNIDMFPSADREMLREGITVTSLQNAYEIIENFTS